MDDIVNVEEWENHCVTRLISRAGIPYKLALEIAAELIKGSCLDDSPEDAADEELSYWASDSFLGRR